MTKRTPRPWKVRKAWDGDGYEVYPTRNKKPDFGQWAAVATIDSIVSKGESARKNALLIAAAPDLLESLEEVLAYCKEHGHDWMCMAQARAAIIKATGAKRESA